jgi:predicted nucleic acid-binding protein
MNLKLLIGVIFYLFLSVHYTYSQVNEGSINGIVIDSETGETLIGVNVVLEGTSKGTATDIDGEYILKAIDPGTYTLIVSYISFTNKRITGVKIKAGQSVQIDITLNPETEFLNEIFVTAEVVLDNEAGLFKQRQKSISFSDAISAESITRSGAGDATGAMKKASFQKISLR